ncbi:hypothetical protein ACNS7O_03250 [Haloferacaceae archaeon DSL9]
MFETLLGLIASASRGGGASDGPSCSHDFERYRSGRTYDVNRREETVLIHEIHHFQRRCRHCGAHPEDRFDPPERGQSWEIPTEEFESFAISPQAFVSDVEDGAVVDESVASATGD